jgi:hypothetical protein
VPLILAVGTGIGWKNKGVREAMTWGIKVQRVTFALAVVAALALASGANWADVLSWFGFGW